MKPFAKKFYKSAAWLQCRESYIATVYGLCERCHDAGKIVHHTIYLTPSNIDDPTITLNHNHLEYLCQTCHNQEHHGTSEVVREGLAFNHDGDLIQVE